MGSTKLILALACLCFLGISDANNEKVPKKLGADESSLMQKNRNAREARDALACGTYSLDTTDEVMIESENYPSPYPNPQDCTWTFEGMDPQSTIAISCSTFELAGCRKSSVTITGGDLNQRYCKSVNDLSEMSTTNAMQVQFTSRRGRNKRKSGFSCTVTASDPVAPPAPAAPPAPSSGCFCGKVNRETRIVGWNLTELHEYPYQVALTGKPKGNKPPSPFCGGSIISNQWIMTACHCVESFNSQRPRNLEVVTGEHNWSTGSETSATSRLRVSKIVRHPDYDSSTLDNDICLLKLSEPIDFPDDNSVAPVCLPEAGNPYDNVDATVTGWGTLSSGGSQPYVLYEVTLPTLTQEDCQQLLPGEITENMICAGLDDGGKDSCQGDSGGPMVTGGDDEMTFVEQIGIVSWGYGCAEPNQPGVYARVNNYLDWIVEQTAGSTSCPKP